jgi:hypothetical protein
MNRLQTVTDIGKRAGHDNAHGVIEVGPLHFLNDGNRFNAWRKFSAAGGALVSQNGSHSLLRIGWIFIAETATLSQFPGEF